MSWKHVLREIDGREYILDGIHGTIQVDLHPYNTRVMHEPSKLGKETEAYQATRRVLRDEWSTDLSQSERVVTIAYELLGLKECEKLCFLDEQDSLQ